MVAKRVEKYQRASFSRSVVMTILIAGGAFPGISYVSAEEENINTSLFQDVELTEGASGLDLDFIDLLKLQRVTDKNTKYSVGLSLSWKDFVAQSEDSDLAHGLAFLFKTPEGGGDASQGFIFYGSKPDSRMDFENIKSLKGGAAIYSDKGTAFRNFSEGLSFCRCESSGSGGAIASLGGLVFQENLGCVEWCHNSSQVESLSALAFVGGGALFSPGTISLRGNQSILCCENSTRGSGGGLLADGVIFSETAGDIIFKNNSSEWCGGAARSKNSFSVKNSLGNVLFEGNKAKYAGGALFVGDFLFADKSGKIEIDDNIGSVCFARNSSASVARSMSVAEDYAGGGALWSNFISLSSNLGDISFSENQGGCVTAVGYYVGGGAILATDEVLISGNSGAINFIRNQGVCLSKSPLPADQEVPENKATDEKPLIAAPALYKHIVAKEDVSPSKESLEDIRGGGAILSKCIEIADNTGHIGFGYNSGGGAENSPSSNTAIVGGGALLGFAQVSIERNAGVSFLNNTTSGVKDCGGAILSNKVNLEGNTKLEFISNGSSHLGGAICALENAVVIKDNVGSVSFSENRTRFGGGAISAAKGSVIISENSEGIEFLDNIVFGYPASESLEDGQVDLRGRYSGGGAILARNSVEIKDNSGNLLFSGNRAGAFGGAILVGSLESTSGSAFGEKVEDEGAVLSITGNSGDIVFFGNSTSVATSADDKRYGGGAIHTQELRITDNNGSVSFYNNRAAKGAAVKISENGGVVLQALGGDIGFQGNINFDGENEAIYLSGTRSKIKELSAAAGKKIIFQDSITFENLTIREQGDGKSLNSPTLFFNAKSEGKEHLGTIVFSQGVSKIPQIAGLQGGTLALVDGAELWLGGLKQEPASEILLAAGTSLKICENFLEKDTAENQSKVLTLPTTESSLSFGTPKSSAGTGTSIEEKPSTLLDLNRLSVDISSFTKEFEKDRPLPPKVIFPEDSINGLESVTLKVVDVAGLGYENHALLGSPKNIPLVEFSAFSTGSLSSIPEASLSNIKVSIALPEMSEETYGHVGVWSEPRVEGGKLVVDWKPTGYNLNPEKQGSLILNALWGVGEDLRAIKLQQLSHNMTAQRMELDFSTNIWAAGIGTFSNCSSETKIDGFTHRAGAYVIGMDTQLIEDFLLGGSFSQCLGYTSSASYDARNDHIGFIGSGYVSIFAGSWLFKGSFVYGKASNDLKTHYANSESSSANWNAQGFLADVRIDYRYIVSPRKFISAIVSTFVPFVEAEYVRVDLPEVREIGHEARTFQPGRLENVAIPLGVTLEQGYSRGSRSEVNSLSVAYIFDVYRQQPETVISLPEAAFSWKGEGADIFRKALKAQLNNDTEWSSYFSTHFGVNYEWREHISTLDVNAGVRVIF